MRPTGPSARRSIGSCRPAQRDMARDRAAHSYYPRPVDHVAHSSVAATLILLAAGPAFAEGLQTGAADTTWEYAGRGLVLEQGVLRFDAAPADFGLRFGGVGGRSFTQDVPGLRIGRVDDYSPGSPIVRTAPEQTILQLTVGAAYGIMENLEVGTVLLPIQFAPNGDFGDIEVYGRYRFLSQDNVQIGAQLTAAIPTNTRFTTGLGVPVQLRFDRVRIDTGAELEILFGDGNDGDGVDVDLDLPVAVSVDIIDGFFGGVRSGFFSPDFDELAVPLMGHVGYTLMSGKTPFVDLVASFGWPRLVWTGFGDNLDLDTFDVILGARIYFTAR